MIGTRGTAIRETRLTAGAKRRLNTPLATQSITVVLVDDHPLARSGVRQFLKRDRHIEIVGETDTEREAVDLIGQLQPDVVILDIRLRHGTGINVVRAAKAIAPNAKTLVLTAYDDDRSVDAFVKLGAAGYMLKTTSPAQLRRAVHNVAAGSLVFAAEVAPRVKSLLDGNGRGIRRGSAAANRHLTIRQAEVLEYIGQGFRNREIAETLGISVKTVEAHVERVLQKLGVTSRTEAVVCAVKNGWLPGTAT